MIIITPAFGLAALVRPVQSGIETAWQKPRCKVLLVLAIGFIVGFMPYIVHRGWESAPTPLVGAATEIFMAFQSTSANRSQDYLLDTPAMLPPYGELIRKELGVLGMLGAISGIVGLLRRRQWTGLLLLTLPAIFLLGLHGFWNQLSYRYALNILVFLYPIVGLGLWFLLAEVLKFVHRARPGANWISTAALSLLCVTLLVKPVRTILRAQFGDGITRSVAIQFRNDMRDLTNSEDVVLVDLNRNTTLFCSSTYWLDNYVFSPFSTGTFAEPLLSEVLDSERHVFLISKSDKLSEKSESLLKWAASNWQVERISTVAFIDSYSVWRVTPRL